MQRYRITTIGESMVFASWVEAEQYLYLLQITDWRAYQEARIEEATD